MGKRLNDTTKILNTPYSSILGLRDTMNLLYVLVLLIGLPVLYFVTLFTLELGESWIDGMIQEDFTQEVKREIEENGYDFLDAVPLAHETCELYDYNLREEATAEYREKEIKTLNEKKD